MPPVKVVISNDKMGAFILLQPGCDITPNDVRVALRREGVIEGISPKALQDAISGERGIIYQVAWGVPPSQSILDSFAKPSIIFNYPESRGKPPETLVVGPDFAADWRRLLNRGVVNAGSNLGFLRSRQGLPKARAVTGEEVPFVNLSYDIKLGPNTRLSPDGVKILAERPGIPYEDETGIGVLDHITIEGDIGPKTGSISFPGDISVRGNIASGVSVSTSSNLMVSGNLWGSATARGKIVVSGGITAPGEVVESGGGISAKFCENSVLRSSGPIVIGDALIHSVVETDDEVELTGQAGRIVGGLVRAEKGLRSPVVGSPMGVPTVIELGISPKLRREVSRMERELAGIVADLAQMARSGRDRLFLLKKSFERMPKGFFQAGEVLPGTRLVRGTDVHEFTSPIDMITMGARRK